MKHLWSRREAISAVGALGAGLAGARGEQVLPWRDLEPPPDNAGARFTDLAAVEGAVVPTDVFFVLQHGDVPRLDVSAWRLSVLGEVEREMELNLSELRSLGEVERLVCFECAGNGGTGRHGLVGNALFRGVPLAEVLARARPGAAAREVVFHGADAAEERLRGNVYPTRFARSLSVEDAFGEDVLLATEMNGEALRAEHGFPVRLVVPGWYGVAQVKWLTRIELLDRRFMGWYMAKDYVTVRGELVGGRVEHRATSVGRQRLKSVISRVVREEPGAPRYRIEGFAWNHGARILNVDVRIDDGAFRPASLAPSSSPHAWVPFTLQWRAPEPGRHRLVSRARDVHGVQPTAEEAARFKATPWENDGQVVREIEIPPQA